MLSNEEDLKEKKGPLMKKLTKEETDNLFRTITIKKTLISNS